MNAGTIYMIALAIWPLLIIAMLIHLLTGKRGPEDKT